LAVVPREIYKAIEWHFFNYAGMKQALDEYEEERLACAGKTVIPEGTGRGIGRHSDSTAMLAIDRIEGGSKEIKEARQWIWVVESVAKSYEGTAHGQLIKLYYKDKYSDREVAKKLGVDRSMFYFMKADIVTMAYLAAIQKKLLKVF
jgi:hypothetical protein